jgi:RHS repeat-associated protein
VLHTLKGGDITSSYEYYDNGFLKRFSATNIVDMEYVYDGLNNLYSREDKKTFQKEVFGYDDFNRLTNWNVTCNGVETAHSLIYDGLNIQSKSDLLDANENPLTLNYGEPNSLGASNTMINATPGPHALTSISGEPTNFPANNLSITYTDFKKIKTLTEGNKIYELSYGVDDQRNKSVYKIGSTTIQTRYYVGDYEEEYDQDNKYRKIHYLSGAIYIDNEDKPDSLYYTFSDYQGSVIAITDNEGTVKRRFAYDPWGQRRNPTNWNESDNLVGLIVNRGYTSHEHLDAFGIINMNGRVYDPLTAQFLSPDPYVQSPDNWVNYNRYGYCFGNPLKYTDPSGYYTGWDDAAALLLGGTINLVTNWHDGITPLEAVTYFGNGALTGIAVLYAPEAAPAIIAASGALNDLTRQSFQSDGSVNFDNVNWGQVAFSGMMSGLTSVVGGQVGQALHINTWFSSIESTLLRNVLQNTTTNLIVSVPLGGFTEYSNGGDFWEGAWSGAKMGLITGTISGIGNAATYSLNNKVDFLSGKSLQVSSYQKGQNGVQQAILDIQNQGGEVLGTEVTFDVNGVRTRVDIVANIDGVVTLIEVKNGPYASFTTNQKAAFKSIIIDQARPTPVGGNAFKAGLIVGQPLNNFDVRLIKYW